MINRQNDETFAAKVYFYAVFLASYVYMYRLIQTETRYRVVGLSGLFEHQDDTPIVTVNENNQISGFLIQ